VVAPEVVMLPRGLMTRIYSPAINSRTSSLSLCVASAEEV
jgi:hypothetical protein